MFNINGDLKIINILTTSIKKFYFFSSDVYFFDSLFSQDGCCVMLLKFWELLVG